MVEGRDDAEGQATAGQASVLSLFLSGYMSRSPTYQTQGSQLKEKHF